jgi:hypothetical protein
LKSKIIEKNNSLLIKCHNWRNKYPSSIAVASLRSRECRQLQQNPMALHPNIARHGPTSTLGLNVQHINKMGHEVTGQRRMPTLGNFLHFNSNIKKRKSGPTS